MLSYLIQLPADILAISQHSRNARHAVTSHKQPAAMSSQPAAVCSQPAALSSQRSMEVGRGALLDRSMLVLVFARIQA